MYASLKYAKYYCSLLLNHWLRTEVSYAQHGEDLLIESIMGSEKIGSFIDIGANDGVLFSNTYKFAKSGSHGLCIEPSRTCFRKLRLNHLLHPKVKCLHSAISEKDGVLYLQEHGYEKVLSKVSKTKVAGVYPVKSFSLLSTIERYPQFSKVDLISIDVEGHEHEVLKGCGQAPIEAKIIIIEIDKLDTTSLIKMNCLSNHIPKFSNDINLVLTNKNFKFNASPVLPSGFYKC